MSTGFLGDGYAGRTIDGRYTLLCPIGSTESSSVFLAECGDEPKRKAAIKFFAANSPDAQDRLTQWERAKTLSHAHLIEILQYGRCELDGNDLLYIVTEYADEVLSEILPMRALTPDEAREMMGPVLEALSYLHEQGFVHAHLKPSNILVVDDRIKLSADGILAVGTPAQRRSSPYDAPEMGIGPIGPEADLWSIGLVLVQALTQALPEWNRDLEAEPKVPVSIAEPFLGIARECLRVEPTRRLTLSGVMLRLNANQTVPVESVEPVHKEIPAQPLEVAVEKNPVPPISPVAKDNPPPAPAAAIERVSAPAAEPAEEIASKPSLKTNIQAVLGTVMVLGIALLVMRAGSRHAAPAPQQPSSPAPQIIQPAPPVPAAASSGPVVKGEVASRTMPDIPQKIASGIRGHIKVAIRAQVDAEGNVVQSSIESPGSSRYFADQALQAAQKWKFTPAWIGGRTVASVWVLHFQFAAAGSESDAQEMAP